MFRLFFFNELSGSGMIGNMQISVPVYRADGDHRDDAALRVHSGRGAARDTVIASERRSLMMCSPLGMEEPLLTVWVYLAMGGKKPGAFALISCIVIIATVTVWCVTKDKKKVTAG